MAKTNYSPTFPTYPGNAGAITVSDTNNLEAPCVIYVGAAGNVKVTTAQGTDVTFVGAQAGQVIPVQVIRVWSTGTTVPTPNTNLFGISSGFSFSQSAAWTPAQLPGLALWLDAADASTITLNGSTVSQWNDKSGNNRHASQATAANQPTYSATGLNGKPTLTFDGLSDNLQATIPSLANQNNISFFGVTQILTRKYSVFLGSGMGGGTTGIRWGLFGQGNLTPDGLGWAGPGSDVALGNGSLVPINTPYQAVYTKTPTQWQILLNGSTISTVNDTSFPTGTYSLTIGAEKEGSYQSNALASEIIIIGGILSTADRQLLEGYLAWKWSGLI
jgi:hypothetical protein